MKKRYVEPIVIRRDQLNVNNAVAACSLVPGYGDMYQAYAIHADPAYYSWDALQAAIAQVTQGDAPPPINSFWCRVYYLAVTIPATEPGHSDIVFHAYYEDWNDDGMVNDFVYPYNASNNYAYTTDRSVYESGAATWAVNNEQDDFIEDVLNPNYGHSISAINS